MRERNFITSQEILNDFRTLCDVLSLHEKCDEPWETMGKATLQDVDVCT